MSIGDNIKTFFQGFFHHDLKVGKAEIPTGGITGGTAALIESKEAKELAEAKTNENEQVETQIDELCAHEENLKKLESPAAKIFAGKLVSGGARALHDFVEEKLPEVHEKSEEMYKKQQENKEKGAYGKMPIIELGKKIGEWIGGIFKK